MVRLYFRGSLKDIFPGEYEIKIPEKKRFMELIEILNNKFGEKVYQYVHRPNGNTESPSLIIIKRNGKMDKGAFASEILEEIIEPSDEIYFFSLIAGG